MVRFVVLCAIVSYPSDMPNIAIAVSNVYPHFTGFFVVALIYSGPCDLSDRIF